MRIPKFTGSDFKIMITILVPYVILLNFLIFGTKFLSSAETFITLLVVSLSIKIIFWQFHTWVAVWLRNCFPSDRQIIRRIVIALLCFYLMTAIANSTIVLLYLNTSLIKFDLSLQNYLLVLGSGVVLNTFTTLVHEGVSTFEKWKMTLTDTERLRTEYAKSRLEGLKNQIKPHFLFNSINTLSALITVEPSRAEIFLDEMCMVYRYLLRNHMSYVTMSEELEFIRSYFFIVKARFGDGLIPEISITAEQEDMLLPPFTLQQLLENILKYGKISRSSPLQIEITSAQGGIIVSNTISHKILREIDQDDFSLSGLRNKFKLLGVGEISVWESEGKRNIFLPLLPANETEKEYEHI